MGSNQDPKGAEERGTERLLRDVIDIGRIAAQLRPVYPTLLAFHLTKSAGVQRIITHGTAKGTRVVVTFSPLDAGENNETNNERQRYEILVNPLPPEEGEKS